jgi:hypothetical protein
MKRTIRLILAALTALALPSCFQQESTITLNKDGSGTLTEQMTLGAQALAMMAQIGALGGGGEPGADPLADMASEEKALERAKAYGEGVTVEKVEAIPGKGVRRVFRFADINKVKFDANSNMMEGLGEMPGAAEANAVAEKADPISFKYADGVLTVKLPQPEKPEAPAVEGSPDEPAGDVAGNPEMEAMMKEMMGDMRVSVKIVVPSGIEESTATFVDGNAVTLLEMDMGKILKDPENLKKLTAVDQNDPGAAMEAFKGVEGAKAEMKPEITIKVK